MVEDGFDGWMFFVMGVLRLEEDAGGGGFVGDGFGGGVFPHGGSYDLLLLKVKF